MGFVLQSARLGKHGFRHGFSLRAAGDFALLRDPEKLRAAQAAVGEAVGFDPARLYQVRQVHGARVLEGEGDRVALEREEADALVGRSTGSRPAVAVRVADCVPILLADPETGDVAAVHAGWRGVEARILQASVTSVTRDGSRLVAAIGPCIGPCCFEVGEDVAERIAAVSAPAVVVGRAAPKAYVDLRAAVRAQLRDLGLADEAIEDVGACTRCNPTDYHSFRRDGEASGRLLAVIVAGV